MSGLFILCLVHQSVQVYRVYMCVYLVYRVCMCVYLVHGVCR